MKVLFKNFIKLSNEEQLEILKIRNSDFVRKYMKSNDVISFKEHIQWIKRLQYNQNNKYYAVFFNYTIIGAVYITNIDYNYSVATWGLYFKENINPLLSSITAYCIIDKIFNELNLNILNLEVNIQNKKAYSFDLTLGFQVHDENEYMKEKYYLMLMSKNDWNNRKNTIKILKLVSKKIEKIKIKFEE